MRDPFTWSFPFGRLFGIIIRVHILFPFIAVALILRVAFMKDAIPGLWIDATALMIILFASVLLHEFGHCYGARAVHGEANEVMLWPLGGLAFCEVPHTPKAHFITAAAGPLVNVGLCVAAGLLLAMYSLKPPLLLFTANDHPLMPRLYSWADGVYYGTRHAPGDHLFIGFVNGGERVPADRVDPLTGKDRANPTQQYKAVRLTKEKDVDLKGDVWTWKGEGQVPVYAQRLQLNAWQVFLGRLFWLNWFMLLLNLLPAFPLDGGRMFHALLWARTDYRHAMGVAIFAGFIAALVAGVAGVVVNEIMIVLLALFIYVTCRQQYIILETGGEDAQFGYDFSQGYTSLERGEQTQPPRRRRESWWQRWLKRRAERKRLMEQERREAEERRMDELLQKVQSEGLHALTDEERRFLTRVSARYRNRQ